MSRSARHIGLGDPHFHIHLGLVPAESRNIIPMPQSLAALVPLPEDNLITEKPGTPDTEKDTMPLLINKMKRTLWQTKKLAAKLVGNSFSATLQNDSDFILKYIKYKKDDPKHEQIRSPRRLVYERKGDCDCFTSTIGSLLLNQGIKFKLRIAHYDQAVSQLFTTSKDWAHIYVIVPNDQKTLSVASRTDYTVLDPVTNKHNYEVPFVAKKDYDMNGKGLGSLQFLDGYAGTGALQYLNGCEPAPGRKTEMVPLKALINRGLIPTSTVLQKTQNLVATLIANGEYTVTTPQGDTKKLPAVLTPDQANLVTQLDANSSPSATQATAQASAATPVDNRWKWGLGIAAVLALIVGSSDEKRPALAGLAGRKTISHYKI